VHWQSARRPGLSQAERQALYVQRQRHLEALARSSFYHKLLDPARQRSFTVSAGGRSHAFTLLGRGLSMTRFQRPVVVVLDSLGSGILFYKSTGMNSGMPGKWLPFRSIVMTHVRAGHGVEPWYEKFREHEQVRSVHGGLYDRLSDAIRAREAGIEFLETSDLDLVASIAENLGVPGK